MLCAQADYSGPQSHEKLVDETFNGRVAPSSTEPDVANMDEDSSEPSQGPDLRRNSDESDLSDLESIGDEDEILSVSSEQSDSAEQTPTDQPEPRVSHCATPKTTQPQVAE